MWSFPRASACRRICVYSTALKNYYDALGVSPQATHSDIKAAYYRLSMVYHPDKNKGSSEASQKFRDITSAYEVLGNFRLRKLYDKGILHSAGHQYQEQYQQEEEDEQTKFYKSRMTRDRAPPPSGRTPIYNFDEWSQAHYGETFARRSAAKRKYDNKVRREINESHDIEKEIIIMGLAVCIFAFVLMSYIAADDHDTPPAGQMQEAGSKSVVSGTPPPSRDP